MDGKNEGLIEERGWGEGLRRGRGRRGMVGC